MAPGMIGRPAGRAVVGLVALATGACMVGPNYEEPVTPVADAWQSAVTLEMSTEEPVITRWWEALGDSTLTSLIRRSELQSLNLQFAVARVAEARALRGFAKGDLFPSVTLEGAYSRVRVSENSPVGQVVTGQGGAVEPANQWETRAAVGWEIDLFGRIRRSIEAATAQFQASIEDYRDVQVSLYAEVAANYVEV
ncbi:MAG: TolC family protein, partial [Gemmatimonadota bacterium]|nr:TolC family protein [Gemmatimonadota bacterium]